MSTTDSASQEFELPFESPEERVLRYFKELRFDPAQGTIDILGQRYLLLRTAAMSVQFFEVIKHLYRDKGEIEAAAVARSLLYDFAHALGAGDSRSFHRVLSMGDLTERLVAGTIYFAHTGWTRVEIQPETRLTPDENFLIVADHPTSFEAGAWLELGKQSDVPVCIMSCGYPAGWCAELFGIPLVMVEVSCKAMGDDCCRFVMAMPHKIEAHIATFFQQRPYLTRSADRYEIPGFFSRKKIEDELREREAQYRGIFEAATDAMLIVAMDGAIVAVNPAAHQLFGYLPSEMERLQVSDLRQLGSSQLFEQVRASVRRHGEFAAETVGVAKDGRLFDVEFCATAFSYRKQQHLLVVIRDITEQKRIELERLRQQEETARQTERLRADLALARSAQSSLLPDRPPWDERRLMVANRTLPAYEVGGDFYTYVTLGQQRYAIVIGDISGKGVTAALLMSLTASSVESQALQADSPAAFLHGLNQRLGNQLRACRMFAALLYMVVDLEQRTLYIGNAGMIAPILVRDGTARLLDVAGLPLGIINHTTYPDLQIDLQLGDRILLVSDGVVEARNQRGELWGFERLLHSVVTEETEHPEHVIDTILADVRAFIGGAEPHDDMTLIVVQPAR